VLGVVCVVVGALVDGSDVVVDDVGESAVSVCGIDGGDDCGAGV